jgi:hypothetical protein
MAVLAKLDVAFASERRVMAFGSAAARLMRAYATQVEVLRRLRNGGQQFVRVEHVHVNDGGQAIVGNVKKPDAQGYMTIRKERAGFNLAPFPLAALVLSRIRTRIWLFSWFPIRNCLTRDSYLNAPSSGSAEKWFYGR